MCLSCFDLSAAQIFLMFFEMSFDGAEFFKQLVVLQNLEILNVEVSFVVTLESFVGLAWVDAFEDAKLAEVLQADLH